MTFPEALELAFRTSCRGMLCKPDQFAKSNVISRHRLDLSLQVLIISTLSKQDIPKILACRRSRLMRLETPQQQRELRYQENTKSVRRLPTRIEGLLCYGSIERP